MSNIDFILERKNRWLFNIWVIVIGAFMFIIMMICIFYNYKLYGQYQAVIKEQQDGYYLNLYLTDEQISDFNHQKIYLDGNEINKRIVKISEDYILNEQGKFRLLTLDVKESNLAPKYLVNNNVITIKVCQRETTIMKEIINKVIKGGT